MKRRDLAMLIGGALAWPLAARAQSAAKPARIGFIVFGALDSPESRFVLNAFREGLRERGHVEGRNLVIEYRWAEGNPERLQQHAEEFAALKVDAILTHATAGALAAVRATKTIPVVAADGSDPVAAGLVTSLARPGGNVTGSFSFTFEEVGKRLQLLKETVPGIKTLAFLASPFDPSLPRKRKALLEAALALQVEVREHTIRRAEDLPEAFNAMSKERCDALLVNNEPLLNSHIGAIASLAAVKRLPSVGYASFADAGGLLAYGANRPALYGRAGYFLDRIFKGARPGDLPFERAARFDVIANLKVAKALGVAIPRAVLLRTDRVIE